MPSVTDIQQQQQSATSTDSDPLTQAILVLEKKQRNLGKRKEKLESCKEEAKKGKELNKDQNEALAKYPDVLGQIECVKELTEQVKKIQTDSSKNQKRLLKQAAEEKRLLLSQSLCQYAQIRYLLEHRPTSIKPEEISLLDQLSTAIIPSNNSSNSISRSVDTVLSIYQNGPPSTIKSLTGKTPQEVREVIEGLIKSDDTQQITPPPTSEQEQTNDNELSTKNLTDYPLQFDTRNQNIPLEQIIEDNTFFSIDLNNQIEENKQDQASDQNQYLSTITVDNSNVNDQPSSSTEIQQEEQWQQGRGNRGRQFNNENENRNYHQGGLNNYYQQPRRGPHGGRYDNSYGGGGQRQYNENNRGRGGYRGNRGGGYRGYSNNHGNVYQKSTQHQQVHSAPPSQE